MNYRRLGKTRFRVSEIGFGGLPIAGDRFVSSYGATDDSVSKDAIRRALDLGINLFDTADIFGHGHSEVFIGEVLATWPGGDRAVIVTKGGINFYRPDQEPEMDFTPYGIAHAVEQSRIRLRRDTLDVYLLMNAPIAALTENDRVWDTLRSIQSAGRITAFGVSVERSQDAVELLERDAPIDVMEVTYNLLDQGASVKLFSLASKKRVGLIAREPLANGLLSGRYLPGHRFPVGDLRGEQPDEYIDAVTSVVDSLKFLETQGRTMTQAALRFVLDNPEVSCAVPGCKTSEQVAENASSSHLPRLTDEERLAIHHVFFPEDRN